MRQLLLTMIEYPYNHNKLSHGFSTNNKKRCCQVHVQATLLLKRNKHWNAFRVWLYEKQLGSLRGISLSPRCCWYVIFLLFLFCVYIWSSGMTRLPRSRLSKRNEMNKNRYKHFSQPVKTKIMRMRMYKFKLTKS